MMSGMKDIAINKTFSCAVQKLDRKEKGRGTYRAVVDVVMRAMRGPTKVLCGIIHPLGPRREGVHP